MNNESPRRSIAEIKKELEEAEFLERKEAYTKRLNYESIKNTAVTELCNKALQLSNSIASFKKESFEEINALHEILKDYSQRHANGLGNFRVHYGNFRVIPFKLKTYWNNNFLKYKGSRYVFSILFQKLLEQTVAHLLAIIVSSSAKRIESHFNLYVNFRKIQSSNGINYKKQGRPTFDEKSTEAEGFIKDFVTSKFENDDDVKDLIISLLERKNGEFDINLIQKLYKMEDRFDDANWKQGIKLMKESYSYEFSKDYVTFEQKGKDGNWKQIPLSFSNI